MCVHALCKLRSKHTHTHTQDEPTSGVDPAARQFLWSVIRGVARAGQSVLITTHSMAECEALCSRVGIMVNGSFCCLGTPQQLKSRYGDGYRLKLRVSGPLEPIQEFIRQNFPSSVLKVSPLPFFSSSLSLSPSLPLSLSLSISLSLALSLPHSLPFPEYCTYIYMSMSMSM